MKGCGYFVLCITFTTSLQSRTIGKQSNVQNIVLKSAVTGEFSLLCKTVKSVAVIRWMLNDKKIALVTYNGSSCSSRIGSDSRFLYKCNANEFMLTVPAAQVNRNMNGSRWTCQDPRGPSDNNSITIYVAGKDSKTLTLQATIDGDLTLICKVEQSTKTIAWTRNDAQVALIKRKGSRCVITSGTNLRFIYECKENEFQLKVPAEYVSVDISGIAWACKDPVSQIQSNSLTVLHAGKLEKKLDYLKKVLGLIAGFASLLVILFAIVIVLLKGTNCINQRRYTFRTQHDIDNRNEDTYQTVGRIENETEMSFQNSGREIELESLTPYDDLEESDLTNHHTPCQSITEDNDEYPDSSFSLINTTSGEYENSGIPILDRPNNDVDGYLVPEGNAARMSSTDQSSAIADAKIEGNKDVDETNGASDSNDTNVCDAAM